GETRQRAGQGQAYWPMEVLQRYPSPNGEVPYEEGEHGFCVIVLVTGSDPACDKPADQVCTIAKAPFRSYVRHGNQAPWITKVQVSPETPRPGQEVLLRAQAQDNDTEPRPDRLTYTWDLGPEDATGPVIRHTWNTPGTKEVELQVTDGFEVVNQTVEITVAGDGEAPPSPGPGNGTPLPGAWLVLPLIGLAALGSRRAR
ncbi:MAG: PKD domain-containing protein, partial [Candidatus Thermoplasmatota archaeon]|nr:PKD domain-containing protein [Candidatus Thermoplasmatota archaeon]